jgi:hypothetical protein
LKNATMPHFGAKGARLIVAWGNAPGNCSGTNISAESAIQNTQGGLGGQESFSWALRLRHVNRNIEDFRQDAERSDQDGRAPLPVSLGTLRVITMRWPAV